MEKKQNSVRRKSGMTVAEQYQSDVDMILAKRYDNGGDYWATLDKRLIKGSPFTTLESALMLTELGMLPSSYIERNY